MQIDRLKDLKIHGLSKLLHRIFLVLTYPFRHPFWFLICVVFIIIFLFLIPIIKGVPFTEVLPWYFTKHESQLSSFLAAKVQKDNVFKETPVLEISEPKAKFKKIIKLKRIETQENVKEKARNVQPVANKTSDEAEVKEQKTEPKKYTVWNIKKKDSNTFEPAIKEEIVIRAPIEEKAEEAQTEVLEQKAPAQIEIKQKIETIAPIKEKFQVENFYKKVKDLELSYLDHPKKIKGTAVVYGPNELYVDSTYLYLYGIYTDPVRYDTLKATQYLRELIDGNYLECYIVAYTVDQIATAVCFVNKKSINQNMVDAGMARSVALLK